MALGMSMTDEPVPARPVTGALDAEWMVTGHGREVTATHSDGRGLIVVSHSFLVPDRFTVALYGRGKDAPKNSGRVLYQARSAEDDPSLRGAVGILARKYDDDYRMK